MVMLVICYLRNSALDTLAARKSREPDSGILKPLQWSSLHVDSCRYFSTSTATSNAKIRIAEISLPQGNIITTASITPRVILRHHFPHNVKFSYSVVSDYLTPDGLHPPDFPVHHQLPELAQTHVHQVSDTIQPSHPLLTLQSFPASGSYPMNQFFASGGQGTGVSTSASVFSMNIQG